MTVIQPPKPIDTMTPEELERWEDLLESHAETHSTDCFDTLEELRKLLNSSKLEAMHMIKKQSRFGNQCPYYLKARSLFDRHERRDIFSLLEQFLNEAKTQGVLDD